MTICKYVNEKKMSLGYVADCNTVFQTIYTLPVRVLYTNAYHHVPCGLDIRFDQELAWVNGM
jgi:hypothetical protein